MTLKDLQVGLVHRYRSLADVKVSLVEIALQISKLSPTDLTPDSSKYRLHYTTNLFLAYLEADILHYLERKGESLTSLPHRYLAESYLEVGGGLGSHEFGSTGLREVLERRIEAIKKNRLSSILEDILGLPDPSRPYYKGYLERSDEVLVLLSFLGFTPEQITDEIERILK